MTHILYTKQDCQKCDYVKARLTEEAFDKLTDIEIVDITDPMPHRKAMILNGAYGAVQRTMPVLVTDGGAVISGALSICKFFGLGEAKV